MAYGIKLEVWGDYAAFNRPEMKVERVSYDVMTPAAARGILEAIYWKPQMRWVVDRIHVLAPIRFTHIRRNEIASKIPIRGKNGVEAAMKPQRGAQGNNGVEAAKKPQRGALGIAVEEDRQQRAAMVLRDVRYGIEAHLEVLDPASADGSTPEKPEAKHLDAFKRRAMTGQCFHHPYLGCREFPASFALVDSFPPCPEELRGERDLGFMLHDIAFCPDPKGKVIESNQGRRLRADPRFFRVHMRDGVIVVPPVAETRR